MPSKSQSITCSPSPPPARHRITSLISTRAGMDLHPTPALHRTVSSWALSNAVQTSRFEPFHAHGVPYPGTQVNEDYVLHLGVALTLEVACQHILTERCHVPDTECRPRARPHHHHRRLFLMCQSSHVDSRTQKEDAP